MPGNLQHGERIVYRGIRYASTLPERASKWRNHLPVVGGQVSVSAAPDDPACAMLP